MTDRFKFRVWDKQDECYAYSNNSDVDLLYIETDGNLTYGVYSNDYEDMIYIPDSEVIIEQCTGLKDINGKLIYAGDILGNKDFMSDVALLKYNNEKCCYILERQSVDDHFNKWWADRLMVIGNIHENKELLKWQKIFLI